MASNGPELSPKSTTSTIGSYPMSLHRFGTIRAIKRSQNNLRTAPKRFSGPTFPLVCAQSGLKWPLMAPTSKQGSYLVSVHRIQYHWGQKRGQNRLRTAAKHFLGSTFSSCLSPKWPQIAHKWPPKQTTSKIGSYSVSLHNILDHWGPKRGQKKTQNSSRMFLRVYFFLLSCFLSCLPKRSTLRSGALGRPLLR